MYIMCVYSWGVYRQNISFFLRKKISTVLLNIETNIETEKYRKREWEGEGRYREKRQSVRHREIDVCIYRKTDIEREGEKDR